MLQTDPEETIGGVGGRGERVRQIRRAKDGKCRTTPPCGPSDNKKSMAPCGVTLHAQPYFRSAHGGDLSVIAPIWRWEAELNRCRGICSPLPNRLATPPNYQTPLLLSGLFGREKLRLTTFEVRRMTSSLGTLSKLLSHRPCSLSESPRRWQRGF